MEATAAPPFVHLHLHTEYSLLDGGNKILPLIKRCKELGMNAVAMTDHGNLFGTVEFYTKCKTAGVKPILGIEAYVAPDDRTLKQPTGIADGGFHLVLLAENNSGWANLLKLSTDAYRNGFYYKPRMDKSTLEQWGDGLIAINGHLGSSIAHHLTLFVQTGNDAHWQDAIDEARWHMRTFGPNKNGEPRFFIELQRHDTPEQERINPHLIELASALDLPLVCDNDAHFLTAEDWDAHDSLCCISMQKTKDDTTRMKYPKEVYVKSPQQMAELFADVPEAVENAGKIAARCNVELDFKANHAPVVRVVKKPGGTGVPPVEVDVDRHTFTGEMSAPSAPVGSTEWFKHFCSQYELLPYDSADGIDQSQLKDECDNALRELCEAGLIWRYGENGVTPDIRTRLERELTILADKLISAYFLIVWDFVNWARQNGIPANARGSGIGTMVGYVLGLSNACPEKYGLLFERFTDPDRSEYPDIDIDICQDGRAAVIDYVRNKYGHVAQIVTFGRLKAKAAIKDVARVMGLTPSEGQRLANLVPGELNITLDAALEKEPDFRSEYESNMLSRQVIDTARALENHARHMGVHAAGVVIATQPLDNIVPLCKATGSDDIITQWDGPTCEKVGLLKMDFLGLRTLSTIELAKRLIRETLSDEAILAAVPHTQRRADDSPSDVQPVSDPLDLDRLTYDDPRVFDLFSRADTAGIFQFESGGMRKLLSEMKPDRLEDLIAANALFRPGPMDLIHDYCMRKHGRQPVPQVHEIVDRYTAETYGIMVYQEQVMQIVHSLGDIPLREAYSLIKAISKKKEDVINALRPKFIEGAAAKGLPESRADELFDLILKFAGYGFNKSHSTGYSIIAYQTAYLKTYFPNQYMAALLTYESAAQKVESWAAYMEDCRNTRYSDHTDAMPHMGVEVKPPDINLSDATFTVVFGEDEPRDALHGHVRFGLGAIKGAGKNAVAVMMEEREMNGLFASIFDFCERVSARVVNKGTLEALIKAGAFDSIHSVKNRAAVLAAIDDAMMAGQNAAEDRRNGQMNFFMAAAESQASAPKVERPLPNVQPWDEKTTLANEKDVLGFHVSGHPLDRHDAALRLFRTHLVQEVAELIDGQIIVLGGVLSRMRYHLVQKGSSAGAKMAFISLMDKTGEIEGVVFSDTFAKYANLLQEDAILFFTCRVDRSRGEPQVRVEQMMRPEDAPRHLAGAIELHFSDNADDPIGPVMSMAAGLLQRAGAGRLVEGGRHAEVFIRLRTNGQMVLMKPSRLRPIVDGELIARLRELLGESAVRIIPAPPLVPSRANGNGSQRWQRSGVRAEMVGA